MTPMGDEGNQRSDGRLRSADIGIALAPVDLLLEIIILALLIPMLAALP